MGEITRYIYLWNDWIVMPALLIAAVVTHWKHRRLSTLLIAFGIILVLAAQSLRDFYPTPQYEAILAASTIYLIGLLVSLGAFVWFMRKDYRARSNGI